MKFYLFEAASYQDGSKDSLGVYTYDALNPAKAAFYSKMGGAMKNSNYKSELLSVMDEEGRQYLTERYVAE